MTACYSAKNDTGAGAVCDPASQHERAYNSGAFNNVEENLEGLKLIIEFVLQSLKKDDSSSPKGIGDFYKEFGLKLKKGRSASSAMTEKDLIYELKTKCSSRDRGGKKLKWKDVLDAAIEVLKLLGGLPFAAVPSIFLVASLTRAETSSKNKMEAAEVISELKHFVDFLLKLASHFMAKMDLCMPLMDECVNVVDEGFWLCTSILIEGKLKSWLGAPSNKESIEKLKQRCGECGKWIDRWLMVTMITKLDADQESIEKLIQRHGECEKWIDRWLMITKSDADLRIREEPSGAKIEKNSFKSEASIKTMELFSSKDTKVYDTTSIQAVNPQMKKSASVHEDEKAAEASMKTMVVFSSKDTKVCDMTSSQAANPPMKKSASVQEDEEPSGEKIEKISFEEAASMKIVAVSSSKDTKVYDTISSQAANPQVKKSASTSSVQEDEEPAKVSMKIMAVSSSKDTKVYDTISSQAANPQMMKSASVHEDEEPAQASMNIMEASSSKDMRVYDTTSSQAANPQLNKSASVHGDEESAEASKKIMELSSSKDSKIYNTTSSQAGNPQMKKSASVHEDAPSADFYEICYGTLETTVQASYNYFFYGKQQW